MCRDSLIGLVGTGSGGSSYRVPKRRRSIDTGDLTRNIDFCRVWRPAHTVIRKRERQRVGRRLIVSIPLTQRGAVHLDELEKTGGLLVAPPHRRRSAAATSRPPVSLPDTRRAARPGRARDGLGAQAADRPVTPVGHTAGGLVRVLQRRRQARRRGHAVRVRAPALHRGLRRPNALHQRPGVSRRGLGLLRHSGASTRPTTTLTAHPSPAPPGCSPPGP